MPIPRRVNECDQQITFKTVSTPFAADGSGSSPVTFATSWAKIDEVGGAKDAEHQTEMKSVKTYEIFVPYLSGITGMMDIYWGSKVLVQTTEPIMIETGNRRWLRIDAEETTEHSIS